MSNNALYLKLAPQLNKTTVVRGLVGSPPTSGDLNYVYTQAIAASVWTINHNLNKYPSFTVIDSAGDVVFGLPSYPNANTLVLTLSAAFTGVAYLN